MKFHQILIALDDRKSSEVVAKSGLDLAKQFGSKVALVSIVDRADDDNRDEPTTRELEDMRGYHSNANQRNIIKTIFKDFPVTSFVEEGDPAEAIVKIAQLWGADIIVMGTHGRKGLSHLIMGSVAEDVIKNSKKTMVVIPISDN